METPQDSEPFIPPELPSPSAPSLQSSNPDHSPPSPSPQVSTGSVSSPHLPPAGIDMFITQLPSPLPSNVAFTQHPVNLKCPHCHIQVTTQVHCVTEEYEDYRYYRYHYWILAFRLLLMLVFWFCSIFIILMYILYIIFCPKFRHTCPNCRELLGYGRRRYST